MKNKQQGFVTALLIIIILLIIGGGVYVYLENKKSKQVVLNISSNEIAKSYPKTFKSPSPEGKVVIEGTEIERIKIPNCNNCYADIVLKMEGVSDRQIIRLNQILTASIFGEEDIDIRQPSKRMIHENTSYIDLLQVKITYAKNGIVSFWNEYEIEFKGAVHSIRKVGSESVVDLKNTDDVLYTQLFGDTYNDNKKNGHKILEHFYPNGKELFTTYSSTYEPSICYEYEMFPESFDSDIKATTREVVFSINYTHNLIGPCGNDLMIAIPIDDILEETPELVPYNSVIRKL